MIIEEYNNLLQQIIRIESNRFGGTKHNKNRRVYKCLN